MKNTDRKRSMTNNHPVNDGEVLAALAAVEDYFGRISRRIHSDTARDAAYLQEKGRQLASAAARLSHALGNAEQFSGVVLSEAGKQVRDE
jgi:hypothetical protein